jgi:hypothetical protein
VDFRQGNLAGGSPPGYMRFCCNCAVALRHHFPGRFIFETFTDK